MYICIGQSLRRIITHSHHLDIPLILLTFKGYSTICIRRYSYTSCILKNIYHTSFSFYFKRIGTLFHFFFGCSGGKSSFEENIIFIALLSTHDVTCYEYDCKMNVSIINQATDRCYHLSSIFSMHIIIYVYIQIKALYIE